MSENLRGYLIFLEIFRLFLGNVIRGKGKVIRATKLQQLAIKSDFNTC